MNWPVSDLDYCRMQALHACQRETERWLYEQRLALFREYMEVERMGDPWRAQTDSMVRKLCTSKRG